MTTIISYLNLTKPRLTLMALVTTFTGFYMASPGSLDLRRLFYTTFGAALIGGGANTLNQYFERLQDAKMIRTQRRPLPSSDLKASRALWFGVALSLAGLFCLFFKVNFLCFVLGLATLSTYLFLYTPMKQITPWNTVIGALPGAAPCLLGWAGARGRLEIGAFVIFLIIFIWQLPHFFAIAWVYKEDYRNGGFKMLSADDGEGKRTMTQILLCSTLLCGVSFLPVVVGLAGLTYLFMAIFCGVFLIGFAAYIVSHRLLEVKKFIPLSILYLFLINLSLVLDKI